MYTEPTHVLYISRRFSDDPDGNQVFVDIYNRVWEAHQALLILLEEDGLVWEGDNWLRSESGIVVQVRPCRTTTHTLRQLWEYEVPVKHLGKELAPHEVRKLRRFRTERDPDVAPERKERMRSTPRASRDGMVPIADLALEFGMEARDVRAAFRKAGVEKPAQGWAFPKDELEKWRTLVKEACGV